MLSFILFCTFISLIFYLIYHRFCYFSIRSIPNPPIRSVLFGHLSELWSVPSYSEQIRKWTLQYGSVYGIFEGLRPVYVISDIKIIQEIFIKQFHHFYARRTPLSNRILGSDSLHVFATNSSQQWKRQRTVLNPAFSTSKMKRSMPIIESCIDIFFGQLRANKDKEIINILDYFKRLTLDVICKRIWYSKFILYLFFKVIVYSVFKHKYNMTLIMKMFI